MAPGTGRSALVPSGNLTTAMMTAVGGTPPSKTTTGVTITGSAATRSTHGRGAEAAATGSLEQ